MNILHNITSLWGAYVSANLNHDLCHVDLNGDESLCSFPARKWFRVSARVLSVYVSTKKLWSSVNTLNKKWTTRAYIFRYSIVQDWTLNSFHSDYKKHELSLVLIMFTSPLWYSCWIIFYFRMNFSSIPHAISMVKIFSRFNRYILEYSFYWMYVANLLKFLFRLRR